MAKDAVSEHSDQECVSSPGLAEHAAPAKNDEASGERWSVPEQSASVGPSDVGARREQPEALGETPILGLALPTEVPPSAPRRRFKTLMGVPRNAPNLELYADNPLLGAALLDAQSDALSSGESSKQPSEDSSTLLSEEPSKQPSEDSSTLLSEEPSEDSPDARQAVAAAELRGPDAEEAPEELDEAEAKDITEDPEGERQHAPAAPAHPIPKLEVPSRYIHAHFVSVGSASLDVSGEVAALRKGSAQRWWTALGAFAAAAALVALGLPREWARGLGLAPPIHESSAAALVQSWQQSQQALQALKPAATSEPAPASEQTGAAASPASVAPDTLERRAEQHAATTANSEQGKRAVAAAESSNAHVNAAPGSTGPTVSTAPARPSAAPASGRRAPLSAPARALGRPTAAPAPNAGKALPGRRNPSRKSGGNGIIRANPF